MKNLGILYRGLVWFSRFTKLKKLVALLMGGSLTYYGLTFWEWFLALNPIWQGVFWLAVLSVVLFTILSFIGFLERGRGPIVTLNEAAIHISNDTFGGLWSRRKKEKWITYCWKEFKRHGSEGDIHVQGYTIRSAQPQDITQKDWQSQFFGFEMGRSGKEPFHRLVAGGSGQKWDRPFMLKSQLYRYWPPIPFLGLYKGIQSLWARMRIKED